MKKLDNRGFSLVELLVAVLILAVITVPMLQMYVMSARTAAKSRQAGDATTAAQNIVETIQARNVAQVLSTKQPDFSDVAALFGPGVTADVSLDSASGAGTVTLSGVSSGSSTFDAEVTMNPENYRAAGSINDKEITQYTAMDGVYYQKSDDMDVDKLAEDEFNQEHSDAVLQTRRRAINIHVSNSGTKVQFTYTFGYRWTDTSGGEPVERHRTESITMPETELFPEGYPADGESFSVYMFFNPYYISDNSPYQDDITINNTDNLDCSVFLVKQNTSPTASEETGYGARVVLRESHSTEHTTFYASIFSNIGEKLLGDEKISNISFRKYYSSVYYVSDNFGDGELINKKKEDRLYDVTVKIYPSGSSDEILTFKGTKLQ